MKKGKTIILLPILMVLMCGMGTAQLWTQLDEGIPDLHDTAEVFSMYSNGEDLYVVYPKWDTITTNPNIKRTMKLGIRKWNGIFWSDLPDIVTEMADVREKSNTVRLIEYKNELYIYGSFYGWDDVSKRDYMIGKFNGKEWVHLRDEGELGIQGVNKSKTMRINTAAVYRDTLYLGGSFKLSTPVATDHFITYNGDTVKKHNSLDFAYDVLDMEVVDNVLYICQYQHKVDSHFGGVVSWNGQKAEPVKGSDTMKITSIGEYRGKLVVYADSFRNEVYQLVDDTFRLLGQINTSTYMGGKVLDFQEYDNKLFMTYRDSFNMSTLYFYDSINGFQPFPDTSFLAKELTVYNSELVCLHSNSNEYDPNYSDTGSSRFNWISTLYRGGYVVNGQAFLDSDEDCYMDYDEKPVTELFLVYDSNNIFTPGRDGHYYLRFDLGSGGHEINFLRGFDKFRDLRPPTCFSPWKFNYTGAQMYYYHHIPLIRRPDVKDPGIDISAFLGFRMRQGFKEKYRITVTNKGTVTMYNLTAQLDFDPGVDFISCDPEVSSFINRTITWEIDSLLAGEDYVIDILFRTGPNTKVNDSVGFRTEVISMANDTFVQDNVDSLFQRVVASHDPNNKQSFPADKITKATKFINYVINFQNLGTDTAYRVVVVDTIETGKLELDRIYMNSTAHPYTIRIVGNVFIWTFNDIMLPDSASDPDKSRGYISYTSYINPRLNIGDSISNRADIYFDYQKPVPTAYATVIIIDPSHSIPQKEKEHHSINVFPNPAKEGITIESKDNRVEDVTIYNLNGKTIRAFRNIGSRNCFVGTEEIPTGTYIIAIRMEGGITEKLKVLIVR